VSENKVDQAPPTNLIGALHQETAKNLGSHQRLIERCTGALGRPTTLYILLTLVLGWGLANSMTVAGRTRTLDPPPFFWLQGFLALYGAVVSTLVLITQTRQQRHSEQRAYLELEVSLSAEQKTAKVIELLEELRRDIPSVHNRVDLVAEAMTHAVDSKAVMTALVSTLESGSE
jgi:uncharacterized membrane protein